MESLHAHHISDTPSRKKASAKPSSGKEYLDLQLKDYTWPLAYMLSATMVGLNFPLGYIFILLILINRFKKNRYDFIIQITLFCGGYSLFLPYMDLHLPLTQLVFIISVVMLFLFKKNKLMTKITLISAIYLLILLTFARMSEESLSVQYLSIVNWLSIIYFIIPLAAFSGREFDIKIFFKSLFPYLFIFCAYYVLDGLILCGNIFMPRDPCALFFKVVNHFWSFQWAPLSFKDLRVWPQGLYIMMLCIYPLIHYYKLRWWQWGLILIALYVSRTSTFVAGILVCIVVAQGNVKRMLKYVGITAIAVIVLYFVDSEPKYNEDQGYQSTLRIRSTFKQFTELDNAQFDEDFAEFGSNRMAQVIPKMELLYKLKREWIGLGFLSREGTKIQKYIIVNDLYENPEEAEEVATGVEVVPIQIILNVGYLGLILHILIFIAYWWVIRKYKDSTCFASMLFGFAVTGIGGFAGLIAYHSLYLCGLAYAAIILQSRREIGGFAMPKIRKTPGKVLSPTL